MEYGVYLRVIRNLYPGLTFESMLSAGGGSRSRIWSLIKANVCNLPVKRIIGSRGAPLGAAMVAAVAVGLFADFADACAAWVRQEDAAVPNADLVAHYAARAQKYESLLKHVTELYRR